MLTIRRAEPLTGFSFLPTVDFKRGLLCANNFFVTNDKLEFFITDTAFGRWGFGSGHVVTRLIVKSSWFDSSSPKNQRQFILILLFARISP